MSSYSARYRFFLESYNGTAVAPSLNTILYVLPSYAAYTLSWWGPKSITLNNQWCVRFGCLCYAVAILAGVAYCSLQAGSHPCLFYQLNRYEWSVNASSDYWFLYGPSAPGGTNGGKTLAAWMSDATFGATLRVAVIGATGFNLGTGGGGTRAWIDWSESSLVNNGARVDF